EKETTVPDHVRSNVAPLSDYLIVQRTWWALGACERQRTEFNLARAARFPGPASAITVDARCQFSIGFKVKCVLRAVGRHERRVVAALEFHELPRRSSKRGRRRGGRCLTTGSKDCQSCSFRIEQLEVISTDRQPRGVFQRVVKWTLDGVCIHARHLCSGH